MLGDQFEVFLLFQKEILIQGRQTLTSEVHGSPTIFLWPLDAWIFIFSARLSPLEAPK